MTDTNWWKETTIYQIYPRSFMDSNGDGIGDLKGIISKLDYIKDLGFETIWVSPFFKSPQEDFGYDISDYLDVSEEYGTMDDVKCLIDEVHALDMKIVFDMVLNHTSDKHPWFIESSQSKDSPKRDWYIWKDGKSESKPPTNWLSQVSGNGWQYSRQTNQWYWAAFLPFQPDLNYRNKEVKETMFQILRHYLEMGVDGFRLDIIGAIFEDEMFRDNPFKFKLAPTPDDNSKFFQSCERTENLDETIQFSKELRSLMDEYEGRFLLGETFGSMKDLRKFTGQSKPDGLHTTFVFKTITTPMKANAIRELIFNQEKHFPKPWISTWVYANHDSMRRMTWYRNKVDLLKIQVLLQHTLRGIPITYQGEEIGMKQGSFNPKDSLDPVAKIYSKYPNFIFNIMNRLTHGGLNRDGCRTPMQWDDSLNAGFSTSKTKTWLPVNEDFRTCNVFSQLEDDASLLNFYKSILEIRKTSPALRNGDVKISDHYNTDALLTYTRTSDEKRLIIINFSKKKQMIPFKNKTVILSTHKNDLSQLNEEILEPYEGRIYHLN